MNPPVAAIVGRPNVGKSTLFNALVGRRVAIVEPTSGVTRDRVGTTLKSPEGVQLELVDTGGMGIGDRDKLARHVEEQIQNAVVTADVLVFVVDGAQGLVPQDQEIAKKLRKLGRPVILVVNKTESPAARSTAAEFHRLGLGEPLFVSAEHRRNTGEVRDRLFALAEKMGGGEAAEPEMKLAIVGQRNVGKSTFINTIAKEGRVIVSELAGTTRDSVDVRFERGGRVFVAIDTAGIRRNKSLGHAIEFFSRVRAEESIRRADVVLLMIDVERKISQVDKKIAQYITEHHTPCVIVVNKWDLARDVPTDDFVKYIEARLPQLTRAPITFVSALKGRRIEPTIDLAFALCKQASRRVRTSQLNNAIEELKTRPRRGRAAGKQGKVYYATQVGVSPPAIVLFVNDPARFTSPARKFIRHFLSTTLGFPEVPILVKYKKTEGALRQGG